MDLQKLIDSMNEQSMNERSNYHLTYGELIKALEDAPANAFFDERVKGIGSWRGSYIEIALFTDSSGFHAERMEFNGDYKTEYDDWKKNNVVSAEELPKMARELAELLKSLVGLEFVGYKGGNYRISENKPLWLNSDEGSWENIAIIGIDENLKLITKEID